MATYYEAINWNAIEDVIDKSTWEKLTEQFWLDTRIPLSNDLDDWRTLSDLENYCRLRFRRFNFIRYCSIRKRHGSTEK